jgi:hypothetical protein
VASVFYQRARYHMGRRSGLDNCLLQTIVFAER